MGVLVLLFYTLFAWIVSTFAESPEDSTLMDTLRSGLTWTLVLGVVGGASLVIIGLVSSRVERRSGQIRTGKLWGLALISLAVLISSIPIGVLVDSRRSPVAWVVVAIAASIAFVGAREYATGRKTAP